MIDIKDLLKNPEKYKKNFELRNNKNSFLIDEILNLKLQINKLIKEINLIRSYIRKNSKTKPSEKIVFEIKSKKEKLKNFEIELNKLQKLITEKIALIPNVPADNVPYGKDENENVVIKTWGKVPEFNFQPKDHLQLGEIYDLIDVKKASKIVGSRFYYLKNEAVLLEFGLIMFVYDLLLKENFIPIIPPVFIKENYYRGMGRLNDEQREERYYLPKDDLYLIGSAEHTIGPYFADEILLENNLPIRFLGFSTCFRREAGSYGKDIRGILRTHQFDKIEMFSFSLPEKSEEEHQYLLSKQEQIMQMLELPYRVVFICTGDLGFTDYKQYDIETWLPGQNKYRETHSCSNTTDFQARGINVRLRRKNGKLEYPHMLNATALAIGRILIAIFENYQREDYIQIPTVLQKYVGKEKIEKI